ncbi:MAG: alpha/beta hydrolase [Bacteroidota bacterium]
MSNRIRIFLLIIAMFGITAGPAISSPIPRTFRNPFRNSHILEVDSVLIHYRLWTSNTRPAKGRLLFIHGFTGSTYSFRKNYDSLVTAGYDILALDLPAFGYSDRGTWINQSQSHRAILIWKLIDFINKSDTTKWNIIGHSMGGAVAEAVALMKPGRTKSLTLVDAIFFKQNSGLMSVAFSPAKYKKLKKFYVDYVGQYLLTYDRMAKWLENGYKTKPDSSDVTGYMMPLRIPGTAEAFVSTFSNCSEVVPLNSETLKNIPVLVIWGSKDGWLPPRSATVIRTLVPQAEIHTIMGAGHMPMETHPVEFNGILLEFLNRSSEVAK